MLSFIETCEGCDLDVDAVVACDAGICSRVDLCADCVTTCEECGWHFCADHFDAHVCTKRFPVGVAA